MFTIIKSKGKKFTTSDPEKALKAYMLKKSLSIYYNGEIVLTKCLKSGTYTQAQVWEYIDQYCNLKQ